MARLWSVHLTSFRGISPGAIHYYAKLNNDDGVLEVTYLMNADEAAEMTDPMDHYTYVEGEPTGRFFTKEAALECSIAAWRALADGEDFLVRQEWGTLEPGRPLAGPPKLKAAVQEIFDRAEAIGWWGKDENYHEMESICKAYADYLRDYGMKVGGYNGGSPGSDSIDMTRTKEGAWIPATKDERDAWMDLKYGKPDYSKPLVAPTPGDDEF